MERKRSSQIPTKLIRTLFFFFPLEGSNHTAMFGSLLFSARAVLRVLHSTLNDYFGPLFRPDFFNSLLSLTWLIIELPFCFILHFQTPLSLSFSLKSLILSSQFSQPDINRYIYVLCIFTQTLLLLLLGTAMSRGFSFSFYFF